MRKITSLISCAEALFAVFTLLTFVTLGPIFVYAQVNNTNNFNASQKIGVKITSPKANQTVPIGELIIYGTSSDTPKTNCQVYADRNNTKPRQNVTGIGPGGPQDYSNWTFTYTQNYHVINEGTNDLTSKISCYGNSGVGNATVKYYSINITGIANSTSFNIPTMGNFRSDNSTTGFHSIAYSSTIPQDSNASTNSSQYFDQNVHQSIVYTPTDNDYSGSDDNHDSSSSNPDHSNHNHDSKSNTNNDNGGDNKKDSEKTKSHTIKHSKSLKVEKIKHGSNNLKFEGHRKNLNKYIHNVVKERLHLITERRSE